VGINFGGLLVTKLAWRLGGSAAACPAGSVHSKANLSLDLNTTHRGHQDATTLGSQSLIGYLRHAVSELLGYSSL
jgi:hypothetical protein